MKLRLILLFILFACYSVQSQVYQQTGAVQYNYPILQSIDAGNRMGTEVSLQYVAGNGVKVTDLASNVGLGWALNAGGYILRVQNGEPDDQYSKDEFPVYDQCADDHLISFNRRNAFSVNGTSSINYVDNYYPNGFLYSEFPVNNGLNSCAIPAELVAAPTFPFTNTNYRKWKRSRRVLADRMQDEFIFNFNGRIGKFYIGRDGSILITQDSKLKISKVEENMSVLNIRTRIKSFIITDEHGIEYLFSTNELSEVIKLKAVSSIQSDYYGVPNYTSSGSYTTNVINGDPTGKYIINKWLLTEIKNPKTNKKIQFLYNDCNIDCIPSVNVSATTSEAKMSIDIFEQRAITRGKQLFKIITATGHAVEFGYSGQIRKDEGGQLQYPITSIKYSYNQKLINSWVFEYGYFYKKNIIPMQEGNQKQESERRYLRLCLKSISKTGADAIVKSNPIKFEYHTGTEDSRPGVIVPPVHSLFQDHWGYYTIYYTQFTEDRINNKYPPPSFFLGVLHLTSSQKMISRSPLALYGVMGMLKKISFETGGTMSYEIEQNTGLNGVRSPNNLNANLMGGVRVKKVIISDGANIAKDNIVEYKYELSDGTTSGWGGEPLVYSRNSPVDVQPEQGYVLNGIENVDVNSSVIPNGLRTSKSQQTSGGLANIGITALFNPGQLIFIYFSYMLGDIINFYANAAYSTTVTNHGWYAYNLRNPIGFQYSRVIQKNISANISAGSVITEYTDQNYYGSTAAPLEYPYEPKMRCAPWKFGLIKKVSYYDNSSTPKLQKEEVFEYDKTKTEVVSTNTNFRSVVIATHRTKSFGYISNNLNYYEDILYRDFFPITGRVELIEKKTKSYNSNGLYTELVTNFTYDNNNYLVREIETTDSKGSVYGEKINYPYNYLGISGALATMRTANMINIPVSTIKWVKAPGSSVKKLLNFTVSEFGVIANNDIKPITTYSSQLTQPTESLALDDSHLSSNLLNFTFLKLQKEFTYNENGRVAVVEDKGAATSSVIYDYNGFLPVATILNGIISDGVAFTSFEADGNYDAGGIGKWGFWLSGVKDDARAITGNKVYDLTGGLWQNTLNPQKKYTLTFWVKGQRPGININYTGGSQIIDNQFVLIKSVNGWDLWEGHFQGAEEVGIWKWNNNSVLIDELRLYPYGTLMTTTTYDPRFGKTSECDANNKLVYYDYNSSGQLSAVRNENRDIVKIYEYNYKQIGNDLISQSFTKTCSGGLTGSVHIYSVPANTYLAATKELANQLAQNDINSNGQNYANNQPSGTCSAIYARMEVTNWYHNGTWGEADVAIRFYSDQACTQPVTVSNLTVSFTEHREYYDFNGQVNEDYPDQIIVNGSELVIWNGALMYDNAYNYYGGFYRYYELNDMSGYIVAY